ncbi:ACS family tartrate transporter-like MFS transporter [Bradyrhizobium huanghuaihaiense]|uniref:ACS family tartrate transporter-like MFS transporter n=1 Tax=Bradyrhizobium huanghuaihaiense TaxID=990078 RepID=A0A562R2L4_9BRAD|nr:MFS transporter [Bradyrhizobium huanghuaihaiense]TWI63322.1 ACS family tartrate transporter-like MFS transporter [Bradyrhizobium huanghuaihaiense]
MSATAATVEQSTMRKVFWRIVPYCFGLYVISYLDRANIGYAALQMNKELALSSEAFGFAAGIFFIGYFLFEVPSNVALNKYGARIWISRILISWGLVATASAFVQSAMQLYVLRFLLGVAEAGFFPGIIIYLTYWFRAKEQATTVALFTAAIPVSYLIGAPLSTWIMDHVGGFGLSGWRWMLLLEGGPAVIAGVINYFVMTDRPEQAKWLSKEERDWLSEELRKDHAARGNVQHLGIIAAITNPKVLFLSVIYFIYQVGNLGIGLWMPQIIKGLSASLTNFEVGLVAMLPYAFATVAMVLWSRNSDRTGERQKHSAIPLLLGAVALALSGLVVQPAIAMALISLSLAGIYAFKSPFWSLPGLFLTRSTAAVSIAAINSIGNLGGFAGPYAIGAIKDATGSTYGGLLLLSALLFVSFLMTWFARMENQGKAQTQPAEQPA